MKTHNLTMLGYIFGASIITLSIGRWFFLWVDVSQGLMGVGIGALIVAFSYFHNWMRNVDDLFKSMESRINALVSWWMKIEKEDVRNRAKGGKK